MPPRERTRTNAFFIGGTGALLLLVVWALLSLGRQSAEHASNPPVSVHKIESASQPLPEGINGSVPPPPLPPPFTSTPFQPELPANPNPKDLAQSPTLPPLVGPLAGSLSERKKTALTMATAMIGPLIDSMVLSAEKKSLVLNAMADHQTQVEERMIGVHQGKPPPNLDELRSIDGARDQSLKEILGEAGFREFNELVSTRVERNLVAAVSEHLNQTGEPLTSDQQSDLLGRLIPAYRDAQSQAQDASRAGTVNRRMDALGVVLDTATRPLTDTQKKAIQSFMDSQREAAQLGL